MTWRDWLGLSPSREQFARDVMRHLSNRGAPGWSYDPAEAALVYADARKFFVDNAWREYSGASGAGRPTLLEKYVNSVLVLLGGERVKSLLPQTDLVILGRRDTNTSAVVVPWRDVVRICGRDMQATEDAPPRFRVDSFPVDEWREIESIGRKLTLESEAL